MENTSNHSLRSFNIRVLLTQLAKRGNFSIPIGKIRKNESQLGERQEDFVSWRQDYLPESNPGPCTDIEYAW